MFYTKYASTETLDNSQNLKLQVNLLLKGFIFHTKITEIIGFFCQKLVCNNKSRKKVSLVFQCDRKEAFEHNDSRDTFCIHHSYS